jgi:hypothetical protein
MNEAVVTADDKGLRVEIAPGRKWAIAAVPSVRLATTIGKIRIRVAELSPGARWLMRLYGDVQGTGTPRTFSVFEQATDRGEALAEPDPRLLQFTGRTPLQLQLGLEGEPGAFARFEALEFVPGPPRKPSPAIPGQRNIDCVDLMLNIPQPFKVIDWRARAVAYDRFVFDFNAKGQYLPLIWIDNSRINIDRPAFGLYSYVGDKRQGGANHESVNVMGAVLGATVAGIDKSRQEHNYVLMCEAYTNRRNGSNLVLNNVDQGTGGSFWYEIWPHILFYALADRYPGMGQMDAILKTTADRWSEAVRSMGGPDGRPNLDHTAFNFKTMKPVDNGQWREPDAAAGIAWLEYMAWVRHRDPNHLQAADACMRFLNERKANPYYEVLMPYGAYLAARMNGEFGRSYDVEKFINWSFGISDCRGGWGVILGNWGGYDVHGLVGSVDNRGGYAFAMNTFAQAGALVPLVRYDTRFARAIGKWMLNVANAARLFYPTEHPADRQSSAFWKGDPAGVIAYEGLRREWDGKMPYATGDPIALKWGPATDLGLYGSSYAGLLGGIVRRTSDEKILALDCLATDFFHPRAYPTFLIYNPYEQARTVEMEIGPKRCDLYDAATGNYLVRGQAGVSRFTVPGDRAMVLVLVPPEAKYGREGDHFLMDEVIVDYAVSRPR